MCAYVRFKSTEEAGRALDANGQILHEHHIRVDWADSKKDESGRDKKKAVFVGNVPFGECHQLLLEVSDSFWMPQIPFQVIDF